MNKIILIIGLILLLIQFVIDIYYPQSFSHLLELNENGLLSPQSSSLLDVVRYSIGIAFLLIVLYFLLVIIYWLFHFTISIIQNNKNDAMTYLKKSIVFLKFLFILFFLWIIMGLFWEIFGFRVD